MTIEYRRSAVPISASVHKRDKGGASGQIIQGYAAVFNTLSHDLGDGRRQAKEKILPGAFHSVLTQGPDVRGLVDHNPSALIARVSNGSLKLEEDSHGLRFEMRMIDTQLCRDVWTAVNAGLLYECSFGFNVAPNGESWRMDKNCYVREIRAISQLEDVSLVTFPAYPGTAAQTRSQQRLSPDLQACFERLRSVNSRCNS
jgi:uncharacterized protein